jgi:hypothetical protein
MYVPSASIDDTERNKDRAPSSRGRKERRRRRFSGARKRNEEEEDTEAKRIEWKRTEEKRRRSLSEGKRGPAQNERDLLIATGVDVLTDATGVK